MSALAQDRASRRGAIGASLALHGAVLLAVVAPLLRTAPLRPAAPSGVDLVWAPSAAGGDVVDMPAAEVVQPEAAAPAEHAEAIAPPPPLQAERIAPPPPVLVPPPAPAPVPAEVAVVPSPPPLEATPPLDRTEAAPPPLPPLAEAMPPAPPPPRMQAHDVPEQRAEAIPPPPPPAPEPVAEPVRAATPRTPRPPSRTQSAGRPAASERPDGSAGAEASRQGTASGVTPAAVSATPPAAPAGPILITAPRYRRPPTPPAYPPRAMEFGLTGTVLVRARIRPDGGTEETRIWRSSGHALLDAAAIAAVRRWDFEPGSVDGRRVEAWVEVPVHFRLN
jgi:protein TonB